MTSGNDTFEEIAHSRRSTKSQMIELAAFCSLASDEMSESGGDGIVIGAFAPCSGVLLAEMQADGLGELQVLF